MRSQWEIVGVKDGIIFLQDLDGATSVTNDAEQVLKKVKGIYGTAARVVYQGTDGEWWEIGEQADHPGDWSVWFKRWHGMAWDILNRKKV